MTSPEPSDDELQAVWREMSDRTWPPVHELRRCYERFLILRARAIGRARRPRATESPALPPAVRPAAKQMRLPHTEPFLDNKRRAAGERDDD